ncbi:MAG: hypothetical protein ACSLFR_19445 [Solirubrobacteraceae bacterium]
MREYCAFCETAPGDDALLRLARACLGTRSTNSVQLLARTPDGEPAGFTTICGVWSSTRSPWLTYTCELGAASPSATAQPDQ